MANRRKVPHPLARQAAGTLTALALLLGGFTAASAMPLPDGDAARPPGPPGTPSGVVQAAPPPNALCLACHSKAGLVRTNGLLEQPIAAVPPDAFESSAHGKMACVKCHASQAAIPHASPDDPTAPLVRIDARELCSSCHEEASKAYSHTVHGTVDNLGDERAPGCTDCHSAHAVKPVARWTADERGAACARCHDGADASFAKAFMGHREASTSWFAPTYFAGRFLVVLLACVLAFGTLHVELDMLRWGFNRLRRNQKPEKSE